MEVPQIHEDADAAARLAELGLSVECLHESIEYGVAEAALCTEYDASFFAGATLYSRIGRRLRELLTPQGWGGGNPRFQMRVWNTALGVTLIHARGDDATGDTDPAAVPSQKYSKGKATVEAVARNSAPTLFDGVPGFDELDDLKPPLTWIFLYHAEDDHILSELSLPRATASNGRVIAWHERIILPRIDGTHQILLEDDDDLPDEGFDFNVRRRA